MNSLFSYLKMTMVQLRAYSKVNHEPNETISFSINFTYGINFSFYGGVSRFFTGFHSRVVNQIGRNSMYNAKKEKELVMNGMKTWAIYNNIHCYPSFFGNFSKKKYSYYPSQYKLCHLVFSDISVIYMGFVC